MSVEREQASPESTPLPGEAPSREKKSARERKSRQRTRRKGTGVFASLSRFLLHPVELIRTYDIRNDLRPDLVAGLTVAIIALPQAIAYAMIAELPPAMGLYGVIVAAIVGSLWGSSYHLANGPTNTSSLLVLSALLAVASPDEDMSYYVAAAGILAILVGIIQLVLALARLGILVNFVSDAVITGFTSGAGILIAVHQLRHLLRLDIPSAPDLWTTLPRIFNNIQDTHVISLIMGVITMAMLFILRRVNRKLPGTLIVMVVAAVVTAIFRLDDQGLIVVGELPRSFPPIADLPLTNWQLWGDLLPGAAAVAAIGLMEAISIARSISSQSGQRLDSNQEFFGKGISNVVTGIFSGYPVSGSFTRSAVNFDSGAQTSMAGVFSGIFVLIAMVILAPWAAYVPRAALAGVIIVTAYGLIDIKEITRIFKTRSADLLIMGVTLLATLTLSLEYAVMLGIGISVLVYLLKTSTPRVRVVLLSDDFRYFTPRPDMPSCPQLGVIEILGDLYFGAVSHIDDRIQDNLDANPHQRFLLLRMYPVENCDISGIHTLESIVRIYRERGGDVFFVHVQNQVREVMENSGFIEYVGEDHFLDPDEAIGYLFHRRLDPTICIYECPVRVFRYCQDLPKRLDVVCRLNEPLPALTEELPTIQPAELWDALREQDRPTVIDVRTPREFQGAHIPQAINTEFVDVLAEGVELSEETPLVLVCQAGGRSMRAAAALLEQGYHNVRVLDGGMRAWADAQLLTAIELRQ